MAVECNPVRFGDAGLRDVAVESGVIADGSIAGVLDGRKYNRVIRLHKLMYEALMRLAWAGFEAWLGENEKDNLTQALTIVKDFVVKTYLETRCKSSYRCHHMCT